MGHSEKPPYASSGLAVAFSPWKLGCCKGIFSLPVSTVLPGPRVTGTCRCETSLLPFHSGWNFLTHFPDLLEGLKTNHVPKCSYLLRMLRLTGVVMSLTPFAHWLKWTALCLSYMRWKKSMRRWSPSATDALFLTQTLYLQWDFLPPTHRVSWVTQYVSISISFFPIKAAE